MKSKNKNHINNSFLYMVLDVVIVFILITSTPLKSLTYYFTLPFYETGGMELQITIWNTINIVLSLIVGIIAGKIIGNSINNKKIQKQKAFMEMAQQYSTKPNTSNVNQKYSNKSTINKTFSINTLTGRNLSMGLNKIVIPANSKTIKNSMNHFYQIIDSIGAEYQITDAHVKNVFSEFPELIMDVKITFIKGASNFGNSNNTFTSKMHQKYKDNLSEEEINMINQNKEYLKDKRNREMLQMEAIVLDAEVEKGYEG